MDQQKAGILHDLNAVNFLIDQLLADQLVFLVNVYDEDVSSLVGSVKFLLGVWILLLVVPAHACKDSLVRVGQFIVSFTFPLRGFEPFKFLIVANCEN